MFNNKVPLSENSKDDIIEELFKQQILHSASLRGVMDYILKSSSDIEKTKSEISVSMKNAIRDELKENKFLSEVWKQEYLRKNGLL